VVVVVPRLAERGEGEPEHVGRLVLGGEAPAAEEVADRVDREGHVVDEEDAHQAGPEERRQPARETARDQPAQPEGNGEPEHDNRPEKPVHHAHAAVLEQVGRVLLGPLGGGMVEQPA
jgi:hypothetical protein